MNELVFITGNLNKVKWTQRYISRTIHHKELDLTEIQSLKTEEVIEHKVKEAYKILHKPVIVEDTSLTFEALGQLPGTLIKWFLQELGNDGLCTLITDKNRNATAVVTYGFFDGNHLEFCKGVTYGSIAEVPKGEHGFGWNPIFIPKGHNKTFAEMTDEEIDTVSPRHIAAEKLNNFILNYEKK